MFILRWARQLGRTPNELLAAVDSADITEAMAFERLEPSGSLHLESIMGRICATLANLHLREGSTPLTPADFMPALNRAVNGYPDLFPPPPLSAEELSARIDKALFGQVLH